MPDLARRGAAEFVGTFFLVFFGVGAIALDSATGSFGHLGVSLTFGVVISAMIYAVGHLSGAHFNPAVTVAFCAVRRFDWSDAPAYVASQIAGAGLAAFVVDRVVGLGDSTGVTVPHVGISSAIGVEAILTFALMFVIVSVATDDRAAPGFAGLAIGLAVLLGALVGGPLTGGSMNPARSVGPALVTGTLSYQWLYLVAPTIGAVMGAGTYEVIRGGRQHGESVPGSADVGLDVPLPGAP